MKHPAEKWVFVAFVDGCEQSATDICLILPVIASRGSAPYGFLLTEQLLLLYSLFGYVIISF